MKVTSIYKYCESEINIKTTNCEFIVKDSKRKESSRNLTFTISFYDSINTPDSRNHKNIIFEKKNFQLHLNNLLILKNIITST